MTPQEAIEYLKDPIGKREQHDEAIRMAIEALKKQDVPDRNVGNMISRQAAIDAVGNMLRRKFGIGGNLAEITIAGLPSAQPEAVISKQEYAEFFWGWLEEYRKKSAELQGRYLPFEVLGWVASDFRKCFPERPVEP